MKTISGIIGLIFCVAVAMVGYNVNVNDGSSCPLFWSIMDFFFSGLALIKWLICHQITLTIIKNTFSFLNK